MPIVTSVSSRWILDSRGLPTVRTSICLDQNGKKASGSASVPSGASTGTYEALELRDNGTEFLGKGVNIAVDNVLTKIGQRLVGRDFTTATDLDKFILTLDTSDNKSQIGANAILSVSMASHRAFASMFGLDLWQYLRRLYFSSLPAVSKFPRLMCNVINGGAHADSGLDIQEFMVVPNTGDIESDVRAASEIYNTLKKDLHKDGLAVGLGDEGGFAPNLSSSSKALDYLQKSINGAGYSNVDCDLAMDCAASEFYNKEKNVYNLEGNEIGQAGIVDFYKDLKEKYNIISIEDGLAEDDLLGWEILTEALGKKTYLIGDDLFVTNVERFKDIGLKNGVANGVLIKLNQIGSVLETCEMINLAKDNDYITIVSHRSGETTDDFISDLAYASQSEFIKLGAPARGERVAKYNRLLEIKESLL
ncbi:MAG: phosphopyruvate hydratase [bacterium]